MTLSLHATGLDLTPAVRRLVDDKLAAALRPLGPGPHPATHVAVQLGRVGHGEHSPYRAEATLTGPQTPLRAQATGDTLHQAVARMRQDLSRSIRNQRQRQRDEKRAPLAGSARLSDGDPEV